MLQKSQTKREGDWVIAQLLLLCNEKKVQKRHVYKGFGKDALYWRYHIE